MNGPLQLDVAIAGGGIAGLWLLDALVRAGYTAALFEADTLGGGQTIHSQGIIHSGAKYALGGKKTRNQQLLERMPGHWLGARDGHNPPDLSSARLASTEQYLAFPRSLLSLVIPIAARAVLAKSFSPVDRGRWPDAIRETGFRGTLVRLAEPVFDVPSVVAALGGQHAAHIRQGAIDTGKCTYDPAAQRHLITLDGIQVAARWLVATSGGGNPDLARLTEAGEEPDTDANVAPAQERPLHMVLLKGNLPALFMHTDVSSGRPALTISSHATATGDPVWYLGGEIAEAGVGKTPADLLAEVRRQLTKYFPALPLDGVMGATVRISRHESATPDQRIPDGPVIRKGGRPNTLVAWPTKLAYAPMLADAVLDHLDGPSGSAAPPLPGAPPPVADAPWDMADWRPLS